MAILDSLTIGDISILIVDSDPTITGVNAPLGSLLIMNDGSGMFQKNNTGNTNWVKTLNTTSSAANDTFGITIDGAGSVITTGFKQYAIIPYNCIITGWYLIGDNVGSCVLDVWKHTSIPTVANTITGTENPTLTSQQTNSDTSLSTWTTTVNSGDIVGFNVDSASTITKVTLIIKVTKT